MTGTFINVCAYRSYLGEPGYIACFVVDKPQKFKVIALILDTLGEILELADALDLSVVSGNPTESVLEWITREYGVAPAPIPALEFPAPPEVECDIPF